MPGIPGCCVNVLQISHLYAEITPVVNRMRRHYRMKFAIELATIGFFGLFCLAVVSESAETNNGKENLDQTREMKDADFQDFGAEDIEDEYYDDGDIRRDGEDEEYYDNLEEYDDEPNSEL
ncbi:hypothetical protein RRG08_025231 [Elysia crispata]|uniref:Uncharacterized protein n=1 Tax=Elysia crispata TaxID=231223 RepID=A0AAE1DVA0_9GAST|nr:hypothetical protein RRG08_025231 [Elysia crispata]